jgi:shikimate kinase
MKIFLIGFMGSGKSTIGKLLASNIHYRFVDTDQKVEKFMENDIPSIFNIDGEKAFRLAENKILLKLISQPGNAVISTGGGTPCFNGHMDLMNSKGISVYLKRTTDDLFNFLQTEHLNRPMLSGKTDLKTTINSMVLIRELYYNQAKHIVEIDPEESDITVAERIVKLIC